MRTHLRNTLGTTLAFVAVSFGLVVGPGPAVGGPYHQLSPQEITAQLHAAGYTDVHDVEIDQGLYDVDAVSKAGVPVDLQIDPASGRIVTETRDE